MSHCQDKEMENKIEIERIKEAYKEKRGKFLLGDEKILRNGMEGW